MSLRPIDMQLTVPKTIDYANKQQGDMNRQLSDQHGFAQVVAKNAEQKQQTVIQTNETQDMNNTVNKDGRNKQEYKGRKNKKNNRENKDSSEKKKSSGTGLFDMRI